MNALTINETHQEEVSPLHLVKSELKVFKVHYLGSLNLITVVGWSITDDAWIKYCEMLANIESHFVNRDELAIHFKYELFNTSSAAYMFKIIQRLNKAHAAGKTVKIYWSYTSSNEDEMVDMGLDLSEMCDFEFKISKQ
ncbi:SiaC family regulatory phosphoprotein [Ekhidna sp.]